MRVVPSVRPSRTTGASPERGAYNARVRPLLERALAGLPEEQREVFVLREFSGIPFKEIAEVTGCPRTR